MTRSKQNDHRREELLEQGRELLAEYGYHGTGLKKILDKVQVPKGSFYNYFESKEKFVSEIIEQYGRNQVEKLDTIIEDSNDDPVQTIRKVFLAMLFEIERNGQKGCLVGNLSAEIGGSSKICQQSMKQVIVSWKKRFIKFIAVAQEQNLLRKDLSAEILCDVLLNTWQGALLKMKIDGNTEQLRQTVDVFLNHLFLPAPSIETIEK